MTVKRVSLLVALMSLSLTAFGDTLRLRNGLQIAGMFEGGTSRIVRFRTDSGIQDYDILNVFSLRFGDSPAATDPHKSRATRPDVTSSFGPEQERFIREWFARNRSRGNLPPGLAKRDTLPPGLQRQLQRNGTLPPGLERRVEPLPFPLERELPPISDGMHRVILAGNVILLEDATSRIVDLIRDVY